MKIKVWTDFSKRKNSTKQPAGGTEIDVVLKEDCSKEQPSFILSSPIPDYCYCEAFGHYYFVTDIVNLTAGLCEMKCSPDYMATYKSNIAATTAFVLYDGSSNTEVPDNRLTTKTTATISKNQGSFFSNFSLTGTVSVTVTGMERARTYAIPINQVHNLIPDAETQIRSMFPSTEDTDINKTFFKVVIEAIIQIISSGHIGENIQDVRWLPFTISGGTPEVIRVGQYNTGIGGEPLSYGATRVVTDTVTISIPWQFSDWRNTEPYTRVYCKIPFVGFTEVPASSLKGKSSLMLFSSLDKITGDIAMELRADGDVIGTYGASTAAKIPIGNSAQNLGNIVNQLFQAGVSFGSGDFAGAVGHVANGYTPLTTSIGGISSAANIGLGGMFEVLTVCHDTYVSPSSVSASIGTPTHTQKTISSCPSGYIQCANASVALAGCDHARDTINGYLNSGFFYE